MTCSMCSFSRMCVVVLCLKLVLGQVEFCDLYPPEVAKCFNDAQYHPVNPVDAHTACVREFYVDLEPDLNLTKSDRAFFNLRAQHGYGLGPPPTGFRIRREYRRLSKEDRIRLHSAFNVLYKNGVLHRFGRLHAAAAHRIHRGAAFLPWHRVMLADLEEELRRVDPTVALAYWDHTMDINMTLPSRSVVWTPCFFGNGNGTITEGPFRGWFGGRSGPIQRDYARDECDNGRLMTKSDILRVLNKCRLQDVSIPPEESTCNIETLHDGVHTWVGGDMGDLGLSAFDPIFFFHHAFIDYIWELFRRNQVMRCGVDPETDYPVDRFSGREGHRAFDRMYGYEHLKNVDGLSHIFIKKFYKYETLPQCPDCGSPYLYCDIHKQICVSRDKKACDIPVGRNTYTGSGFENVNIGFSGPLSPGFRQFPNLHPFGKGLTSDPRHRDMTPLEARRAVGDIGADGGGHPFMPFSPLLPLFPSIPGTFDSFSELGIAGLSQFDPLYTPLSWPYERPPMPLGIGKNAGPPILPPAGLPTSPGFVPFTSQGYGGGPRPGPLLPPLIPKLPRVRSSKGYYK